MPEGDIVRYRAFVHAWYSDQMLRAWYKQKRNWPFANTHPFLFSFVTRWGICTEVQYLFFCWFEKRKLYYIIYWHFVPGDARPTAVFCAAV